MHFLALSNDSNDLLSIAMERDGWHHTSTKLDLVPSKRNKNTVTRVKFDEELEGVLYLARSRHFNNETERTIKATKVVCYPPVAKLSRIMNIHFLFGSVLNSLFKDGDKCADYSWNCRTGYSEFSSRAREITTYLNLEARTKKDYYIRVDNGPPLLYEARALPNADYYFSYGVTVLEAFDSHNSLEVLFIGSKVFARVFDRSRIRYFDYTLPTKMLDLCKKIKKLAGVTLLKLTFNSDDYGNYYLVWLDPFPKIPKDAKDEYQKYIVNKMKFIERKAQLKKGS